ncbi:MAG: hypothetical protein R2774_12980 [Saprospiraceae bacterium]
MFKYIVILFLLICVNTNTFSQSEIRAKRQVAYFIGEEESKYEFLVKNYNTMLFAVCDSDMDKSYSLWIDLMKDFEKYAESMQFDIKGVKLWINVFWDEKGLIDYIFFYPKPNSKNMNYDLVKDLFDNFAKQQPRLPVTSNVKFSHYGSGGFPVFGKVLNGN